MAGTNALACPSSPMRRRPALLPRRKSGSYTSVQEDRRSQVSFQQDATADHNSGTWDPPARGQRGVNWCLRYPSSYLIACLGRPNIDLRQISIPLRGERARGRLAQSTNHQERWLSSRLRA